MTLASALLSSHRKGDSHQSGETSWMDSRGREGGEGREREDGEEKEIDGIYQKIFSNKILRTFV